MTSRPRRPIRGPRGAGPRIGQSLEDFRLNRASIEVARSAIGPIRIGDDLVVMRPPRLSDGPAWREACERDAHLLRDSFVTPGLTWEQSISLTAWADRVAQQRSAVDAGSLVAYVVAYDDGRVAGEISFAIDARTAAAEVSLWVARDTPKQVRTWMIGMALLRIFSLPRPVRRVVAPVAVMNPGPVRLFELLGFSKEATARELRLYGDEIVDHDIWWLNPGDELLTRFGRVLASFDPSAARPAKDVTARRLLPDRIRMLVPVAKVFVRNARPRRIAVAHRSTRTVAGHVLDLPTGHTGAVAIDGRTVGAMDVRHDGGTSTLEVWTDLTDPSSVELVAAALHDVAVDAGAHRLAWSLQPGSAEHAAVVAAGFTREGATTEPTSRPGVAHELWVDLLPA